MTEEVGMTVGEKVVDWDSWEGLPKPGTRVRVPWVRGDIEGVVTHTLAPMADGPQVRVGVWLGGLPGDPDLPGTYVEVPYPRNEIEIICE
jgi:hypothetical protein